MLKNRKLMSFLLCLSLVVSSLVATPINVGVKQVKADDNGTTSSVDLEIPTGRTAVLISNNITDAQDAKNSSRNMGESDPYVTSTKSVGYTEYSANANYNGTGYTVDTDTSGGVSIKGIKTNSLVNSGYFTIPTKVAFVNLIYVGPTEDGNPITQTFTVNITHPGSDEPDSKSFTITSTYFYKLNVTSITTSTYNQPSGQVVNIADSTFANDTAFTRTGIDVVLPDNVNNAPSFKGNTKVRQVFGLSDNITTIPKDTFNGCSNLEYVYFPNVNKIDDSAFYNCQRLGFDRTINGSGTSRLIEFPYLQTLGNSVFQNCTSLVSLRFGKNIQTMGKSAFEGCTSLTQVDLTSDGTGVAGENFISGIPDSCFYGCVNLKSIGITEKLTTIGKSAFYGCNMSEFHFEDTQITDIGQSAFQNCNGLTYAVLPNTISDIGTGCFSECKNLRYVYCDTDILGTRGKASNFVSEDYTTFINNGKDRVAPVVSKRDTTTDLDGLKIFGGMRLVIWDNMMDVDPESIKVTRNGTDITNPAVYTTTADGGKEYKGTHNTEALATGGLMYYYVDITANQFGTYKITAADYLGNEKTTTIDYDSNEPDEREPEIWVSGTTLGKDIYKPGCQVVCEDDLGVAGVTINGKGMTDFINTLNDDGTYDFECVDFAGNITRKTIIVDGKAPVVENITDNELVKQFRTGKEIKVTDDNIKSVTLNDADVTSGASVGIIVDTPNVYVLKAVDYAGNEVVINFIYDPFGPQTSIVNNAYYGKDGVALPVTFSSIVGISESTLQKNSEVAENITSGVEITTDGKYKLTIKDRLGNGLNISFVYDKTKPKISNVKNKGFYKDTKKIGSIKVTDTNLDKTNSYVKAVKVKNPGTSVRVREEGKYKIHAVDMSGNTKDLTFTYDTSAPIVKGIKKGKVKKGGVIKFSDKVSAVKSVKLNKKKANKKKVKIKKTGKYTVVVTDKAGNKTTVKFVCK